MAAKSRTQPAESPIALAQVGGEIRAARLFEGHPGRFRAETACARIDSCPAQPWDRRLQAAAAEVIAHLGAAADVHDPDTRAGLSGAAVTALPAGDVALETVRFPDLAVGAREEALAGAADECFGDATGQTGLWAYSAGTAKLGPIRGDEFILAANPPSRAREHIRVLGDAGLAPVAWDLAAVAVCRYVAWMDQLGDTAEAPATARLGLHVGPEGTALWLWSLRRAITARQIPLTRADLQPDPSRACAPGGTRTPVAPSRQGHCDQQTPGVLSLPAFRRAAQEPVAEQLAEQVLLTVRYVLAVLGEIHLDGVDLLGAGDADAAVRAALSAALSVPVRSLDADPCGFPADQATAESPDRRASTDTGEAIGAEQVPAWPVVIGMALGAMGRRLPWEGFDLPGEPGETAKLTDFPQTAAPA